MKKILNPPKVNLANLPTPIKKLDSISQSSGGQVYVKRDDLSGLLLSGNKIRKLEYLLADAKRKDADLIITAGGIQSNHSRATIIAAGMSGFYPVALLDGTCPENYLGNTLLDRYFGARIHYLTAEQYKNINEVLEEYSLYYKKKGYNPYIIPVGGSNAVGCWGYISMFTELIEQERELGLKFDVICSAVGSGGTMSGMILGKLMTGHSAKLIGINVCDTAEYFKTEISRIFSEASLEYGFKERIPWEEVEIIDGFVGPGYAEIDDENMEKLIKLSRCEGIVFDHVYTGKALLGLLDLYDKGKISLSRNVLFVHTGGLFAIFSESRRISKIVDKIDGSV